MDLQVLHYAGSRPFCLETRLINLETVPSAGVEDFLEQSPGSWLRTHVPWTSAEHRIRVGTVGPDLTELLKMPIGTPSLIIERSTWLQGKSVTFVHLMYPGEGHELVASFSPTQPSSTTAGMSGAL